jgi:hypothetical protein
MLVIRKTGRARVKQQPLTHEHRKLLERIAILVGAPRGSLTATLVLSPAENAFLKAQGEDPHTWIRRTIDEALEAAGFVADEEAEP